MIKETKVYSIHSDQRSSRITINRVGLEHSGEYTVEVINKFGKQESSAELTVTEGKRNEQEDEEDKENKHKKKIKKEELVEDVEMKDVSESTEKKDDKKRKLSIKRKDSAKEPEESKTKKPSVDEPKKQEEDSKPKKRESEPSKPEAAEPEESKPKKRLSVSKKRTSLTPQEEPSATGPTEEAKPVKRMSIKKPVSTIPEDQQAQKSEPIVPKVVEPVEQQEEVSKKKISIKKKTSGQEEAKSAIQVDQTKQETQKDEGAAKRAQMAQRVPSIEVTPEDAPKKAQESRKLSVKARKDSTDSKPIVVVEDSKDSGSDRRDSTCSVPEQPPSGRTSRRPSIIIVADEKGVAVDESGQTKKLRPGEMLEVRPGSRRNSVDMRRASTVEIEIADKPSTPLVAIGDEGPPVITYYDENVTAVENKTALIQATVEGNPVPKFKFFKDNTEIFEGGRYKVVTDGETNTVSFCIRKAKSNDEGKYKILAYNDHGEDSCNIKLFVSGMYRVDAWIGAFYSTLQTILFYSR